MRSLASQLPINKKINLVIAIIIKTRRAVKIAIVIIWTIAFMTGFFIKLNQFITQSNRCSNGSIISPPLYLDYIINPFAFQVKYSACAECEIMCYRTLWNISLRSMWNKIRLFTFAKQIFHSEAISHGEAIFHSPKANFVEKSTHLSVDKCVLFSGAGGGIWTHTLTNWFLRPACLPFHHARVRIHCNT